MWYMSSMYPSSSDFLRWYLTNPDLVLNRHLDDYCDLRSHRTNARSF